MILGKHQKRAIAFLKTNEGSAIYREQIGGRDRAWFVLPNGGVQTHPRLSPILLSLIRLGIVENRDGSDFFTLSDKQGGE